jgi:hypothetical protein
MTVLPKNTKGAGTDRHQRPCILADAALARDVD